MALWLSQVAIENGIERHMYNIAQITRSSIQQPDPGALVVFVSPINGFNHPPIMLNFGMRFPKGKNKVVQMNTSGGGDETKH